jgi:hypothetical protein
MSLAEPDTDALRIARRTTDRKGKPVCFVRSAAADDC